MGFLNPVKNIVCIKMSECYKSSERFWAVSEIWTSNVNKLFIGIAYAVSR